jgi:diaminohydroxyphosphoribosylaminopyrimidine deaminase/5-amino-6-(5-phosphoribosylamino)uracil reductase
VISAQDRRWLAAAVRLGGRGRPLSRPNPAVGAILVRDGRVIGRGWTQTGGRPHAEAIALASGDARGATLYVSLEPCAHASPRGPSCADLVSASGAARVVVGCTDPDPRTAGAGIARIQAAGIAVDLADCPQAKASLAGYFHQRLLGRPYVTLKLALSLDGCIALDNGESQWITGAEARAHTHLLRSQSDAIVVGGGTLRADNPRLDVRLAGLEAHSPQRFVLTQGSAPDGWQALTNPQAIHALPEIQYLMIEGGAAAAAAFLRADLVDCLAIYRAPILIGAGCASLGDIGLTALANAHGRWRHKDSRRLGNDILETYERTPCSPASSPL